MPETTAVPLLEVTGLHVSISGREVLRGIDLTIHAGETHVLLGPNGSGKTTLLSTLVGLPGYDVTSGSVTFKDADLLAMSVDKRARAGIGLAFQRPPAVRGVRLRQVMEVAAGGSIDATRVDTIAEELDVAAMLERDVNLGFSGGEAKRSEMAQLLAQEPELALIDEPESGVDLDNIAVVGGAIAHLLKGDLASERPRAGLIVTHTGHILQFVNADVGHVLFDGRLACEGNPLDLIDDIVSHGYEKCVECALCRP
ncbi:MAG: ABC transporter ATP-binding protein [Coriobacteriia bacterium]|nr:ABC transporter ATP-binding protein [Coriobacteriia bacterium]